MIGLAIGLLFAVGLLGTLHGWRAAGPPGPLAAALQRVPGHAPNGASPSRWQAVQPALDVLARLFGGREALGKRLRQAGWNPDPQRYLLGQVIRATACATAAAVLLGATGNLDRVGPAVLVVGLAGAGGLLLGDWLLTRAVRQRRSQIAEQFPVAAQLLALLVSAGAAPSAAVAQVGRCVGGPLGAEFEVAAQRTAAGEAFAAAMRTLADEVDEPVIERFVHGLLSAIERGSPLAEVIREQAIDAGAESHRQLMVAAGKRDIAMLLPVVFGVLPTVVMVSLLPGALQLGLFTG